MPYLYQLKPGTRFAIDDPILDEAGTLVSITEGSALVAWSTGKREHVTRTLEVIILEIPEDSDSTELDTDAGTSNTASTQTGSKRFHNPKDRSTAMAKFSRKAVNSMLVELGHKGAEGWKDAKVLAKLNAINESGEELEFEEDDSAELMTAISKAIEAEEDIEFEDDTKAKKGGKTQREKKGGGKGGPIKKLGIVQHIVDMLEAATMSKPVTKAEIHESLCKAFPDRDPDGFKSTINGQISYYLPRKDRKPVKVGDGFVMPEKYDAKKAPKVEPKKDKKSDKATKADEGKKAKSDKAKASGKKSKKSSEEDE